VKVALSLRVLGTPYFLDAWTGEETSIANYTQTESSTTIPFQLAGNQSVIVAFDLTSRAVNVSASKAEAAYNVKDQSQYYPPASARQTVDLTEWTLVIEHWDAPRDLSRMLASEHR
jgi:endogenous inhibitor of DNA gyrase (YacG/DUF329 family)